MIYQFEHRNNTYIADTLKGISEVYCKLRDESGEWFTTFGDGVRVNNGDFRISYNGRVWKGLIGARNEEPIYSPRNGYNMNMQKYYNQH